MDGEEARRDEHAAVFMEHARWLIEWHDKRGDAAASRAVAVLGFSGVSLALLVQGAGLGGLEPSFWTWTLAIAVGLALLGAASCSLAAIAVRRSKAQDVDQLRSWWAECYATPRESFASDLTESILLGQDLDRPSPLSAAKVLSSARARWLKRAVWCLAVAVLGLALLGGNVLNLARGS